MRVTSRNSTPATSADSASGRQRSGLRRALFVALTLALVLPGIVAGALLIYLNLQHTVDSDARVRAEKLADILQAGLALPLWEITPESGIPLLDAVSTDVSVDAIHVIDAEGTSVLEFSRSGEKGEDTAGPMTIKRTITKSGETLGEVTLVYGTTRARGSDADFACTARRRCRPAARFLPAARRLVDAPGAPAARCLARKCRDDRRRRSAEPGSQPACGRIRGASFAP